MSTEENKRIYEGLTEAWDRGEAERWGDFLTTDFVSHEPGRLDWDRKTWLRGAEGGYAYGSDWKSMLLQVVSEGDMLACHYSVEVTGNGSGIPPAGRRGRREGFEIVRIAGGRIAESWNLWGPAVLLPEAPSQVAGG
jgi:predicted ester cyclase